jgi:hypothetical protein
MKPRTTLWDTLSIEDGEGAHEVSGWGGAQIQDLLGLFEHILKILMTDLG